MSSDDDEVAAPAARIAAFVAGLGPEGQAELRAFHDALDKDHPGLRFAKPLFLQGRLALGADAHRALVETRRRFATPGYPTARRRVLSARERLVDAGIHGVGAVRAGWRADKRTIDVLAPRLPPDVAVRLVVDVMDGLIEARLWDEPVTDASWWYVDGGWR